MGLFDFFKRKNITNRSASPKTTDPYTAERNRVLSILTDQLNRSPNSFTAISLANFLKYTVEFDSDYARTMECHCCCEKCAPYRQRYYSISGKDKRLPKVPDFFLDIRNLEHCRVELKAATDIDIEVKPEIIPISNRPYIDDRTDEEKEIYQSVLAEKRAEAEKEQDKKDYEKLSAMYPDIVPKSFSAYRRLKNSNPEKFKELKQKLNA